MRTARRLLVLAVASLPVVGACTSTSSDVVDRTSPVLPDEAGASEAPQPDAGATTATDASASAGDGGSVADAGLACPPLSDAPDSGARFAIATRSTKPKALDGDLSDYSGCVTAVIDAHTAARVKGLPLATAKIFIEWDPSALWIAAEVLDPNIEGTHPVEPYRNDSLEVYVSPASYRTGDWGPHDHQYVIDHNGLSFEYRRVAPALVNPNARVFPFPGGYRIEMRIDAVGAFGTRLAKDDVRSIDFLLNDGLDQTTFMIWAMQPHASCPCTSCDCNRSPAYDTLLFAPLSLK